MDRLSLSLSLAIIAAASTASPSLASAADAPPVDSRLAIVEQPSAVAFEYDVRSKGFPGAFRETYASVWAHALYNCDKRGGYVTEYHDGFKRSYVDTREGAARVNAYATCRIDAASEPAAMADDTPAPAARLVLGSGLAPSNGVVQASGHPRQAYESARELVYQTCLGNDRRVRFMSTAMKPGASGGSEVEIRFACNAGMKASSQVD
jgi:hypothetical protein